MTHSKRRAHPPRPRVPAPVAPKATKPAKKIVACHFCKKEVDEEAFCHGCKTVVCDECDVAAPNVLWGTHDPEVHLEGLDRPRYRPPTREPCRQCPFRKAAMPGWLGASSPEGFIECIQREEPLPCHSSIDYRDPKWKEKWLAGKIGKTCSGSLALMANMLKRPRDPAFPKLPEGINRTLIFPTAQAFVDHHRAAKVQSWNDDE